MSKKITATEVRLLDAHVEILGDEPDELAFLHATLAQCGLPYREPDSRDYVRQNGHSSLILSAGYLVDPKSRKPILQGLPYGAKPRLLLIHLCSQAIKTQSPVISINDTMSGFMRELGLVVAGGERGTVAAFKKQLNRLAACRMQLIIGGEERAKILNPSPVIREFDIWFPTNPQQKALWPSEVVLSDEFFQSLKHAALPLDIRSVRALKHNARAIDLFSWLAHRLPRVRERSGARVSWQALQGQFGSPDITNAKTFKRHLLNALRQVVVVYPKARVEQVPGGLILRRSAPPIARKPPLRLSPKSC